MSFRLFSIVYGASFLDLFEHACVRSLCWPLNKAGLSGAISWSVWTRASDVERVKKAVGTLGLEVEIHAEIAEGAAADPRLASAVLLKAMMFEMTRSSDERSAFFFAAPDIVFGDGSIPSMIEIAVPARICVSVPVMRVVKEGFLDALGTGPVGNAELAKLSFERMHKSWINAEATLAKTNSWSSGVSWKKIGAGLYAITHLLPSPTFVHPTPDDVQFFRSRPKFGGWDHWWPKRLVAQERQRVIGSSDAAFMAELTDRDSNCPALTDADADDPSKYFSTIGHHAANRNLVAIWRTT